MSSPARPISEKQLEANRRNAQLSTGPKSEAGRNRVRLNSIRHGLTAELPVLPGEDREVHDQYCDEIIETLQPENPVELALANNIAEDQWRLHRARAIENNIFALGCNFGLEAEDQTETGTALSQAETFLTRSKEFALLTVYEQRISRAANRNLTQLRQIQNDRRKAREQALEEAMLLTQLNEVEGKAASDNPTDAENEKIQNKNGFAFSSAEITLAIARKRRLETARAYMRTAARQASNALRPQKAA